MARIVVDLEWSEKAKRRPNSPKASSGLRSRGLRPQMGWVKPYQNSFLLSGFLSRKRSGSARRSVLAVLFVGLWLWLGYAAHAGNVDTVRIDWAYYNPISLVRCSYLTSHSVLSML